MYRTSVHYIEDEIGLWKKWYRMNIAFISIGYNEIIMLTPDNKYRAVLSDLRDGMYVIDALDEEDTYIVDGGLLGASRYQHIQGSMHQIQILGREERKWR